MLENTPAKRLNVHLLPDLVHPHELAGQTLVVIDVLRATTTVIAALEAGVQRVIPCLEVAEARQLAQLHRADGPVLLGGERQGRRVAGFDLGNSPAEYTADRVAGTTLVFTTTNGTRALMRCVGAGRILLGAFTNLSAITHAVSASERVDLVCAGTEGQVSWEDTLFAGAVVDRLQAHAWQLNDAARMALKCWLSIGGGDAPTEHLTDALRRGLGGQNVRSIGHDEDIASAAQLDRFDIVPELNLSRWQIEPTCGQP